MFNSRIELPAIAYEHKSSVAVHKETFSFAEKIAYWITKKVGTIEFCLFCAILTTIPVVKPEVMPTIQYISSGYLQLILLPLIMVGQSLSGRHSEIRAELEYRLVKRERKEMDFMIEQQQYQTVLISKIIDAMGIKSEDIMEDNICTQVLQ